MFRQPGMSRQPAGILASSPQLANTVANRQPVRMANGGTNTYTAAVQRAVQAGDKKALQELAKPVNYGAAARTPDGQNALRLATQALAQSTQISTDAAIDAPAPRLTSDEIARSRGPELAAMTAGKPQGTNMSDIDASPLIDQGIAAAKSAVTGDFMRPLTDAIVKGVGSDANSIASILDTDTRMSPANVAARSRVPSMDDNPPDPTGKVFREAQEARAKAVADADMGGTIPPFGDEFGNIAPDGSMPGETLAASTTTTGKPLKVSTVDPDAPPPKGEAQDAKKPVGGGRLMDSIYGSTVKTSELTKTLEADINKVLKLAETGRTEDKNATDAATARFKKATDVFDKALGTKMAEAKEFNLEDVRDEALKISGVDDSNYDESRKDAFWMGLMRAGLAIAAGESDNALSNVAKGLGVGLEGYGKDIATLNEQEREDRKEIRAISMDLIKTKNAREIALSTAKNDYTFNQQRLAQAAVQGADAAVIAAQNRENTNKLTGLQLQANLNLQLATRKADDKKLAVDTAYRQWAAEISMLPTEAKQALMFGPVEYDENGSIKLSALQEKEYKKILEASTTNKTTVTDTLRSITNAAANGQIRGVKLSDDPTTAQVQSSQWFSVYQKEYENAAKDPLIDENKILDAFAKDIGGTAPSGSGNNTLQPGQVIDISNHPQKDSLMTQKENEPFKIKGVDVVRKGSTIVALSPTK